MAEKAKRPLNKWMLHLAEVRKTNPELSMKEAIKKAKITYVKS